MAVVSSAELRALKENRAEWSISIYLPTFRAGQEVQQNPIRFKNLLREAEERLLAKGLRTPDVRELLEPGERLLRDSAFWRLQSDGLAVFIAPETFHHYRVPLAFAELVVVNDRFHVKPLLPLLTGDGLFYVLALSQNEVRLLQGTRFSVGAVDLEDVPTSLAEALRFDDPERQLQFRTNARALSGDGGGDRVAFHGHESDAKSDILRYFHKVDRGLRAMLADERAPLVLAGVEYLLPIYREANTYPHLVAEGLTGNPEEVSAADLHVRAWALVQPLFAQAQQEAAAAYQQHAGTDLASNQIVEVVPAAHQGRVKTLFVRLNRQQWGVFDAETQRVHLHDESEPGDEDLLDLAATQTVLNGGTVYAVQQEHMPDDALVAAVFRY